MASSSAIVDHASPTKSVSDGQASAIDSAPPPAKVIPIPTETKRIATEPVSIEEIRTLQDRAAKVLTAAREKMLEPQPRKRPPTFTGTEVAELCGITRKRLNHLCSLENDLPRGLTSGVGKRIFTLNEARTWVKQVNKEVLERPKGAKGKVVAVTNFKGGSSKTTTAMHLAQALTLRHKRKVLLVDLDSQASATVLCDRLPDSEVGPEDTIIPFFNGEKPDLGYAVAPTYWDGLSLIPASYPIYEMEVMLPLMTFQDPDFDFWDLLQRGLAPLLDDFDVVVIDTPPSLSYLTFNAVFAADGLVIPTPPESLDFASSAMFWKLFTDLFGLIEKKLARRNLTLNKQYDFVNVLLSKVNARSDTAPAVRRWIGAAYGDKVLPVEIPLSEMATGKAAEFGSVYDISAGDMDPRSVRRIRDETNKFVGLIDQQLVAAWYGKVAR